MDRYHQKHDVIVWGIELRTFPVGIGEAFDKLINMLGGFNRSMYGISFMSDEGQMMYIAAVEEKQPGEGEQYNCQRYTIEKGEYYTVTLKDWRTKTDQINNVFHEMMATVRVNRMKPAVEWYRNNDEMMCMLKVKAD